MVSTTRFTYAMDTMVKVCLYNYTPFEAPLNDPLEPVCQSEVGVLSPYQFAGTVPIL